MYSGACMSQDNIAVQAILNYNDITQPLNPGSCEGGAQRRLPKFDDCKCKIGPPRMPHMTIIHGCFGVPCFGPNWHPDTTHSICNCVA